MKSKRLRPLILLVCCLLAFAPSRGVNANPLGQTGKITLSIVNQSHSTICYVFIAPTTATEWGEDRLGDNTIDPQAVYRFSLTPGDYDLLLQDCDDNVLLDKRGLTINRNDELRLTQIDVSRRTCVSDNQRGIQLYSQSQYEEALTSFQIALSCYQALGDRSGEGAILNNIAAVYHDQGRYDKVLEILSQALAIRRESGDREGEGTILNNIGMIYYTQGDYNEALDNYERALSIQQKIGDRKGEGITLNNIATVHFDQKRYNEALAYYEQALSIQRELGERKSEGTTLNNVAAVYENQSRFDKALVYYEDALLIMGKVHDRAGEATALNNIGSLYRIQGNYSDALSRLTQALAMTREVGNRTGESKSLNNIAAVYHDQGRYGEALTVYEQALAIIQEVGDRAVEGTIYNNIAAVYRSQGRYNEAQSSYRLALAIQRELGDRVSEGRTLNNIAVVYHNQSRYEESLDSLTQALLIQHEVGDLAGEEATLNNIGGVYDEQVFYDKALDYYMQALKIQREMGNQPHEGTTLSNIAAIYHNQGRYSDALENYEQALAIQRNIGDLAGEGRTLNNIGALYRVQERYDDALREYIHGVDIMERIRNSAGNDQARARVVDNYAVAYDRIIELYHQQDNVAQAFWYSERGRARSLLDTISTGQVSLEDNESAQLLAQEVEAYAVRQSAQDFLAKARAANPPDPTWVSEAEKALKDAEVAYKRVSDDIVARSDQLASLIPGRQKVLQLSEIQALLDNETTLLAYWMLEDKALAFVVTRQDAKIVELPQVTAKSILAATESLYQWSNLENPHPRPLRDLYQWLVAPLADTLKTAQIAIIPHQQLHYVPFAALIDESHDKQYFGQQHVLSVLPSANLLPYLAQNAAATEDNATGPIVVFGNPATNTPTLKPLNYAESEAVAIATLFATHSYTGTAASEAQLWQQSQQPKIVHLAAHGDYNPNNALYNAIYLAPGGQYDGRLETHEIFGLPFHGNDLVILSACQSNVGDLSRGDEIVGLTRAFFFAGSATILSSLWNVDDKATEKLMVSFYQHWQQEGMSKAEALQAAQADVHAAGWRSPFYWAAFVLNGHPGLHR